MSNRRINLGCCIASLFVFLSAGCGETKEEVTTYEVTGTVTMDSKPLTNATIAFQNPDTAATEAATLDAAGKFKLSLPAGKYEVSFTPPAATQPTDEDTGKLATANETAIPDAYQVGNTSGEIREVKAGPNSFKFELSKSGPSEPAP